MNPYRLPDGFDLFFYDIELEPDLVRFRFSGAETILFSAAKRFSTLTLHALDLKISRAILFDGWRRQPTASRRIRTNRKMETVELDFGRMLPASKSYCLYLEFDGTLNDKLHGFYRTSYEIKGRRCWGAATQFEATDARRAFPCWDEPDKKAVFRITLRVPKHLTALSNMPAAEEAPVAGTNLKRIVYQPTPRMSTYLVAVVIADLECVQARDKNGVLIRVWTAKGKKHQGRFALKVALHSVPYFCRWFGIPYTLPKLDMVALPDFASGAMENWGLITYRETALLIDPKLSSAQSRQRVAEVIDHELAHQWFGNLVTMSWWTDLWLNEGFASYMGPKAVDAQFPSWKIWNQYVANEYLSALKNDSLRSSHPIEIPVKNPHEIREIFDEITYSKGSSVNRMLEHYLGEPVFRKGLWIYLKRFAYGNASTGDLWSVLEEVSGKPVKAVMASFTRQEGYPLLAVDKRGNLLQFRQKRFVFDGGADSNKVWHIPVSIAATGLKKPKVLTLREKRGVCRLNLNGGWVKINPGQSGFYRTAYSPALLDNVADAVRRGQMPAIDCLGLIDDSIALARAGFIRTSATLNLIDGCREQTDYNVWLTISQALTQIENLLPEDLLEPFARFCRGLYAAILRRCGWAPKAGESHLEKLLRPLVIGRAGHYGQTEVLSRARSLFNALLKTGSLNPDLRGVVYGLIAESGGMPEYRGLLRLYRASTLQEEKVRILRAIGRFRRAEVIRKALPFSISRQVRSQDAFIILAAFGGNRNGRLAAWEFVKKNWNSLTARYAGGGLNLMNHIIEGVTSDFIGKEICADIDRFFRTHPLPGAQRTMKQAVETIRANSSWASTDSQDIRQWLASHKLIRFSCPPFLRQ
ncbi:MAG: M1 family metallopeptidase [Candidatus Omnitrophica bacterium]|nr:M1 family metallopeptidase [Candidatus Omnitrophota bacterium]